MLQTLLLRGVHFLVRHGRRDNSHCQNRLGGAQSLELHRHHVSNQAWWVWCVENRCSPRHRAGEDAISSRPRAVLIVINILQQNMRHRLGRLSRPHEQFRRRHSWNIQSAVVQILASTKLTACRRAICCQRLSKDVNKSLIPRRSMKN